MHHDLIQPVPGAGDDKLILGRSSWSDQDTSIKYGWLDSLESISRGGEMPTSALRQAVRFAAEEGEPTSRVRKSLGLLPTDRRAREGSYAGVNPSAAQTAA
jgi:hypothetical protein